MRIKIESVVWDPKIYPRNKWHTHTIERYADALKAGRHFPPIILEEGSNRLLDGKHRLEAVELYTQWYADREATTNGVPETWPEPSDEIEAEIHKVPDGLTAKSYAAALSTAHGDRIENSELKAIAREECEADVNYDLAIAAKAWGMSRQTIYKWVSDIVSLRKAGQQTIAMRLSMLGWTQQEIAGKLGVSQKTASNLLVNIESIQALLKSQVASGLPFTEIAKRQTMPLQMVWAMALDGLTDEQRMAKLEITVQPYDVWNFTGCDDLFGNQHPGRIPGQLVAHVLYFFTQPGDQVIDPMVGSGTTLDVCLTMGRKCYGYDIDTRHNRDDVMVQDIIQDGWHDRVKKADLIFWDPPYYSKMDDQNIGAEGYIEGSISKLSRDDYLRFFATRLAEAKAQVKPGTKLAFLMSDWDDNTGVQEGIYIWDYADVLRKSGWKLVKHIQAPLSTQQVHPSLVKDFRTKRRMARLERYLLIAEAI